MARITKEQFRKEQPKRRRRKPMTEEQKAAASERLAKAREERLKKNPPKLKHIHPDVLAKPDDDWLSYAKVKGWIKGNREKLPPLRQQIKQGDKGSLAKYESIKAYILAMERYLRDSNWTSNFSGEDREKRVIWRSVVPAYDSDGNFKRQRGVFYDDLNAVWGDDDDNC